MWLLVSVGLVIVGVERASVRMRRLSVWMCISAVARGLSSAGFSSKMLLRVMAALEGVGDAGVGVGLRVALGLAVRWKETFFMRIRMKVLICFLVTRNGWCGGGRCVIFPCTRVVSLFRGRRAIFAGCSWGVVEKSVLSTRLVVVVRSSLSSSVGGGTVLESENL